MTKTTAHQHSPQQDLFGQRVVARLSQGTQDLPREVTERLRAARVRATLARKPESPVAVHAYVLAVPGRLIQESLGMWGRFASVMPAVVLAVGLIGIHAVQNDMRATEVAEVDAALLTDDLPPAAYTDPGFVQFLKN